MALLRKAKNALGALTGDAEMQALAKWQQKLQDALRHYEPELDQMRLREDLYAGTREVLPGANAKKRTTKSASYIRNITHELIESQVDSNIPSVKVSPLHPWNEENARAIESMLRALLDRLPMESINDEQERTCPIQGGSIFLVEWDNARRSHTTVGEPTVTLLHPKQVVPQPGVTSLQKSNYIFVQLAQTKEYIQRKYGVDVDNETESRPEVGLAALSRNAPQPDTKVTQNIVFFRDDDGTIGKFSWVNDTPLEHFENYQARHLEVCAKCGAPRMDGRRACACGSRQWEYRAVDGETLEADVTLPDGSVIPAMSQAFADGAPLVDPATGQPVLQQTVLPYYTPDMYPLVVRKNVSVFGKFLGDADTDKIRDQQEFIKKLGTKIEEKLLKGGSFVTKPKNVSISTTDEEMKILQVSSPQEAEMIKTVTLQPNITYDSLEMDKSYEYARATLGITPSFQGQPDRTATSGVAKRIAVAQSAGRMESKRRLKDAAYADLFALLFRFMLAYCDEPRSYAVGGANGKPQFGQFNRYAFLEQDDAGQWYYNDEYLFSSDNSGSLAGNRESLWQETRMNYQSGTYGQPSDPRALLMFWRTMERLHYPGASQTTAQMEDQARQQQQMQEQAAAQQAMAAAPGGPPAPGGDPRQALPAPGAGGGPGAGGTAPVGRKIDDIVNRLRGG